MQRADKNKHVLLELNDDTILSSKLIYTHNKQDDETKLPTFTFDTEYHINNLGKVNSQFQQDLGRLQSKWVIALYGAHY